MWHRSIAALIGIFRGRSGPSSALAVAWLVATAASAAATETLRLGFILPTQSQLGQGASAFAAEVERRTAGRYKIALYPDAMLGGELEMIKAVKLGTVDLAFITGAPLPNIVPEAGVFDIPYLFHDVGAARAVLDGPIGERYLAKFSPAGFVALAWGENGLRHMTTTKTPVREPADVRGLKLRLPQSTVMAIGFQTVGADVKQIPFPEVYQALQSGRANAEENPIATIVSSHFYQVQPYLSLTGHVYDPAVLLMSKDTFDELSDADKAALKAAAVLGGRASRDAATRLEQSGLAMMRKAGVTIIDDVDRNAFAKKFGEASPEFEKRFGRETIQAIRAYRADSPTRTTTQ